VTSSPATIRRKRRLCRVHRSDRAQGGGPAAILQQGTFADGRAWAELAAVNPGAEHTVEKQVDVAARLALLGELRALGHSADIAEAAGAPGVTVSACEQVPPDVQGIMDSLAPLPASVLNERYDLLGWNEAYAALWPG
jgi:hypothetical protein